MPPGSKEGDQVFNCHDSWQCNPDQSKQQQQQKKITTTQWYTVELLVTSTASHMQLPQPGVHGLLLDITPAGSINRLQVNGDHPPSFTVGGALSFTRGGRDKQWS